MMRLLATIGTVTALLGLTALWTPRVAAAQAAVERQVLVFDIPAQPLTGALQALARQADLQILFKAEAVGSLRSPPISGRMSIEEALDALLQGTSLEHVRSGDVVVVRERPSQAGGQQIDAAAGAPLMMAANANDSATPIRPHGAADSAAAPLADASKPGLLDEVVVTGTLVRGASPASPITVIRRSEIERAGYTTVQQVIDRLPQNYGGGDGESTTSSPGGSFLNVAMGSSVNLRGLGSDSTLVLLDGRRIAPAAFGQFVDISMIPLSAVDRIEVLTDGASATYGSDAVGGVVNILLRKDYEGAETRLKAGTTTDGPMHEYQAGQTFGRRWNSGGGLLTYEFYKRDRLDANSRPFSQGAGDPLDLLPEQRRHSILGTLQQTFLDRVAIEGTALFSERNADFQQLDIFAQEPARSPTSTRQWSVVGSASTSLGAAWRASLAATYGRNDTHRDVIYPSETFRVERNRLQIESLELTFGGPLPEVYGRAIGLALGSSWRTESYDAQKSGGLDTSRRIGALYAEAQIPLLASHRSASLDLSLAGRFEHYNDFGRTSNPKVGLLWKPSANVRLRSTYGTSFRAPLLTELDDSNVTPFLLNYPDPGAADGTTLTMTLTGNNPNLKPEKSKTFTTGIDLKWGRESSASLSITYFDTRFNDRIAQPLPGFELFTIFSQADIYRSIITRPPDPAYMAALAADPKFQNGYGPFDPADIEAFIDRRLQNLSLTRVSGVDFDTSYPVTTTGGRFEFGLSGTYLSTDSETVTKDAPTNDVLDTAFHPLNLKLRGRVTWNRARWSASAFVNHADSYANPTTTPTTSVGSWTTVDLQVACEAPWFNGVRLSLTAINAFDRPPPFVTTPLALYDVGFDPTNANPLGRFISLAATARW